MRGYVPFLPAALLSTDEIFRVRVHRGLIKPRVEVDVIPERHLRVALLEYHRVVVVRLGAAVFDYSPFARYTVGQKFALQSGTS